MKPAIENSADSNTADSVGQSSGSITFLEPRKFLWPVQTRLIVDVRSPKEYAEDHIPGAVNIPLFDDDERAEIGTLYKSAGHDEAVLRGLELVGPKMRHFVEAVAMANANHEFESKEVSVHCWRGGMRSRSFAWLLETTGWHVFVLEGGYKAFRSFARQTIEQTRQLIVLSGLTGAGKTVHLEKLKEAGEQIVDLEGLANHRGSAFGGLGQGDQPSTKQFENELCFALESCDPDRRIWVEDEGNRIGRVVVPNEFYEPLRHAPAIFLDVDETTRVDHLMDEYGDLDTDGLARSVQKIAKRFGDANVRETIASIDSGNIRQAVELTLAYYDRTYLKAVSKMPREKTLKLSTAGLSAEQRVSESIRLADELV